MKRPQDNSRYIASARRHCLLLFALGLLAAQSAYDQSRYHAALALYPYVEKVLAVVDGLKERTEVDEEIENRDTTHGLMGGVDTNIEVFRRLVGESHESYEIELGSSLSTIADPANNCDPLVYQLVPDQDQQLALWVLHSFTAGNDYQTRFEDSYVAVFDASCDEFRDLTDPFVVLTYYKDNDQSPRWAVALTDSVFERLGVDWLDPPSDVVSVLSADDSGEAVVHLSVDQASRLQGFRRKQLTTVDLHLLNASVLSKARELTRQNLLVGDVKPAFQAIFDLSRNELHMWGLSFRAYLVPLVLPLGLLALVYALLHRLNHIDFSNDILEEPWVVVGPDSWVEVIGAFFWSMIPFCVAVAVVCATWVHSLGEREQATILLSGVVCWGWSLFRLMDLFGMLLPWSLLVEVAALVLVLKATRRLWKLAFGEGRT